MIPAFDKHTIYAIARRASDIYASNGIKIDPAYIASEIEFVHDDVVRLRLKEMLNADVGNLMHDVAGIHRHLDIGTTPPTLRNCFVPRFAEHSVSRSA